MNHMKLTHREFRLLLLSFRYVGEMDRTEAVTLLTPCRSGTFLVRVSKSAERMGEYSLSVVCSYPRHIRIQRFAAPSLDGSSVSAEYGLCELEKFPSIPVSVWLVEGSFQGACFSSRAIFAVRALEWTVDGVNIAAAA